MSWGRAKCNLLYEFSPSGSRGQPWARVDAEVGVGAGLRGGMLVLGSMQRDSRKCHNKEAETEDSCQRRSGSRAARGDESHPPPSASPRAPGQCRQETALLQLALDLLATSAQHSDIQPENNCQYK